MTDAFNLCLCAKHMQQCCQRKLSDESGQSVLKWPCSNIEKVGVRDPRETIESSPLCITDLFQNKSVAYF